MSPKSQPKNDRCIYRSTRGRRCRSLLAEGHESLCLATARREHELDEQEHRSPEALAIVSQVLGTREQFKTATQVNDALAKVFALRGRKLISMRDATLSPISPSSCSSASAVSSTNSPAPTSTRNGKDSSIAPSAPTPPICLPCPPPIPLLPKSFLRSPLPPASISVGAPSFPSGKGSGKLMSDLPPASKHLLRKRKRRPLPRTGREFAMQVFDKLAEDRAARKHAPSNASAKSYMKNTSRIKPSRRRSPLK